MNLLPSFAGSQAEPLNLYKISFGTLFELVLAVLLPKIQTSIVCGYFKTLNALKHIPEKDISIWDFFTHFPRIPHMNLTDRISSLSFPMLNKPTAVMFSTRATKSPSFLLHKRVTVHGTIPCLLP